ncbi:MAG: endonuclease [Campylobacterota bacterium]|nr:endonuclease [Campylobacterota bacterium]
MIKIFIAITLLISILNANGNTKIKSFSKAKKILKNKVYNTEAIQIGFYSKCTYESKQITTKKGKTKYKLVVDKDSCGYIPRKPKNKRSNYIEWEHIVPAHAFGHNLTCWNTGNDRCIKKSTGKAYKGRKCCNKVSKQFKLIQADMYNLVPAIGEINGDRNNFTFSELSGEPRKYGDVNFEVNFKARKVEPPEFTKGQIARTYLYFKKTYNLPISKKQMKLYKVWNKKYPITINEKVIYKKIEKLQGNKFTY